MSTKSHPNLSLPHLPSEQVTREPRTNKSGSILIRETAMPKCEICGNDYDKAFQVTLNGKNHIFDSFECAVDAGGSSVR